MGNLQITPDLLRQILADVRKEYAYPPDVHFAKREVPPPPSAYIGPDDNLQVVIYTTSSTTGLNLSLRWLDASGGMHYETETLDGVSTSTLTTKIFNLSEGWLLGISVSNLGGGLADQVCFVAVGLQQGVTASRAPHTILAQGYVSNLFTVDWPPAYVRGPATSSGGLAFKTPAVRGSSITASTGSSFVVSFPAGTIAGDLAIAFVSDASAINTPTGWTVLNYSQGGNVQIEGLVISRSLSQADIVTGSVTITTPGSQPAVIGMAVLKGGGYLWSLEASVHLNQSGTGDTTYNLPSADGGVLATDLALYWGSNRIASGTSTNTVADTLATVTSLQSATAATFCACLYSGAPTALGGLNPTFSFSTAGVGNYDYVGVFREIG